MTGKIADKVAVITAGGSGIGAATARRFAREGAAVVIADISGRRAEEIATDINANGGKAVPIKMDASDPEGVQIAIKLALDTYSHLDIMFNSVAGLEIGDPVTVNGVKKGKVEGIIKDNKLNKGVKVTENLIKTTENFLETKYKKEGFLNIFERCFCREKRIKMKALRKEKS